MAGIRVHHGRHHRVRGHLPHGHRRLHDRRHNRHRNYWNHRRYRNRRLVRRSLNGIISNRLQ